MTKKEILSAIEKEITRLYIQGLLGNMKEWAMSNLEYSMVRLFKRMRRKE